MPAYFDSSVLLSILKREPDGERASSLWNAHNNRVSSILFEIECLTVLKRPSTPSGSKFPAIWLSQVQKALSEFLKAIILKPVDDAIVGIIRSETYFSQARSLDAIHVATALYFKSHLSETFHFITFDDRMARVARSVGLEVLGRD